MHLWEAHAYIGGEERKEGHVSRGDEWRKEEERKKKDFPCPIVTTSALLVFRYCALSSIPLSHCFCLFLLLQLQILYCMKYVFISYEVRVSLHIERLGVRSLISCVLLYKDRKMCPWMKRGGGKGLLFRNKGDRGTKALSWSILAYIVTSTKSWMVYTTHSCALTCTV